MYNQKLAAAIKVNGKVLREFKDKVFVPFSAEYSILLKNLNTVRALVNVFIDGDNIVPGGLVIDAGREIELERSIKNNNLHAGNKLKFIERTAGIEQHRGVKLEDGIVRIEFEFERVALRQDSWNVDKWNQPIGGYYGGPYATPQSVGTKSVLRGANTGSTFNCSLNAVTTSASYNDAGITVPGSASTQSFGTAYWTVSDGEKHTMIFKLLGETPDNKPVVKSVTVKHKPECVTCGRKNKATAKFCTECGTSLEII